jgi:hypothetical protein
MEKNRIKRYTIEHQEFLRKLGISEDEIKFLYNNHQDKIVVLEVEEKNP